MNQPAQATEPLEPAKLEFASEMFKALGHPLRLQLVDLLEIHGQRSVNELADLCRQPQPTVSMYLSRLKNLGLLGSRREGNQVYYFLVHEKLPTLLECIRSCPIDEDENSVS